MINRIWDKENNYPDAVLKEHNYWVVEVSYRQTTLGCYIIFAKRSIEKISELKTEEIDELKDVMKDIEEVLIRNETFQPDRFNYLQLGNTIHHLHFHGIPRYKDKRVFDGKEWIDKDYGTTPVLSKIEVSIDLLRKIRDAIKSQLVA